MIMAERAVDLHRSPPLDLEVAQAHADLEQARKAERSHYLWSMVGLSPLGFLVLIGLVSEGLEGMIWLALFILAVVVQLWQWKKKEREVERLERLLEEWDA